jgi:hypothetical protein
VEALAGHRVLDLGAAVGHAHGIVAEQRKDTSLMDDFVAYSHENRRGHRSTGDIGAPGNRPDPLICVTRVRNPYPPGSGRR